MIGGEIIVSKEENKQTKEIKPKRYSLSKDARAKVQNIHSVMGIMSLQREGLQHSLVLELAKERARMGIKDSDAPEGYMRSVDFDPETFELMVTDVPKPPEPKKKDDKSN